MSNPGHVYGVVLNDKAERERLAPEFGAAPYGAPPAAPVVYMKPRSALATGPVRLGRDESATASPTLALLFARDAARCDSSEAMACVGAMALALDISLPQANYYRPAIGQAIRAGFLALGSWVPVAGVAEIATTIDGMACHDWSLDRLVRSPGQLIADLSAFMTLRAGDVLMIGLPGDAPAVRPGQVVTVHAAGLPPLSTSFEEKVS